MVVQHNLTAMNSNRMLGITTSSQAKSTEKLSSGYKINRAADDAAGLSISEKMRKQMRGLTQASTNAQDGISAVQTAEGALNEVQDMLQRMNELAVKAANGTNSEDDRSYIQDEIKQLETEIDRVAETTKFNETYLLKGDDTAEKKINFKYSSEVEKLSQDLYYMEGGTVKTATKGTYFAGIDSTKTYYEKSPIAKAGDTVPTTAASSAYVTTTAVASKEVYRRDGNNYILVAVNDPIVASATYYTGSFDSGMNFQAMTSVKGSTASSQANVVKAGKTLYDANGVSLGANQVLTNAPSTYYCTTGTVSVMGTSVDYKAYKEVGRAAQFTDKDGNEIAANGLYRYLNEDGSYKGEGLYLNGKPAEADAVTEMIDTSERYAVGALTLKLHVGADATDNNQISVALDAMSAKGLGIDNIKVDGKDDANARDAIEIIKEALQRVSTQRSALGAVQNRLEHTIANLDNVVENTTAAESQIRDTDMAQEMVRYSNNNILAQAGQAMLAQANQSNQGVLSLLG